MSISKAAANALTTTNKEAEGTIVLSEEDKKSRVEKVKTLFGNVNKGRKATLKDKIALGKYLLDLKKELKNEFYTHITNDVMDRKQVGRYIQLILKHTAVKNYTQGMSTKNKDADKIEENLALLVEDTRVTSLTVEQIDTMSEPTMKVVNDAKYATGKKNFLLAIAGDEDVLEAIKEKRSAKSNAKKLSNQKKAETEAKKLQAEIAKKRPENMDVDKYNSLLEEDKPTLIGILQEQIDESNALRDELADLRKLAENAKYYDPDKNKSSSNTKQKSEEA